MAREHASHSFFEFYHYEKNMHSVGLYYGNFNFLASPNNLGAYLVG